MKKTSNKKLNVRKAARFAVVINALQVATMVAAVVYVLLSRRGPDSYVELGVLIAALLIVSWGAIMDIREALNAGHIAEQASMLEDAYGKLEALNDTLRKQRHDFMNHLQVVFSLMEMREYADAMQYVESVYSDIHKAGSAIKTAIPAVNALIAAKHAECDERGIELALHINASWQDLPMPGWEMCRVLGNLIDNAVDALSEDPSNPAPRIDLSFDETAGTYAFSVANNGPAIPHEHLGAIFRAGFTTKSDGHGSGLGIVREILQSCGGEISVRSNETRTIFSGSIPRRNPHA